MKNAIFEIFTLFWPYNPGKISFGNCKTACSLTFTIKTDVFFCCPIQSHVYYTHQRLWSKYSTFFWIRIYLSALDFLKSLVSEIDFLLDFLSIYFKLDYLLPVYYVACKNCRFWDDIVYRQTLTAQLIQNCDTWHDACLGVEIIVNHCKSVFIFYISKCKQYSGIT